jgi:polar amino acid transport system substrate-binding protein
MMDKRVGRWAALLLAAGLVAAACGDDGGGDSESASDDTTAATTTTIDDGGGAAACAAEVELQSPGELTVATYPGSIVAPGELEQVANGGAAYESAVLYAVADQLGFAEDQVVLESVAFVGGPDLDFAQPGAKDFDLAVSNISVTPERDENVDFVVYYDEQQVLMAPEDSVVVGATSVADLSDDTFGTIQKTSSLDGGAGTAYVEEVIAPSTEVMEFADFDPQGDLPAVQAAIDGGTIDALVIDQPSAEFALTDGPDGEAQITGVAIVGVLPRTGEPSGQLGMLFEESSDLAPCVDQAMIALREDGTLEDLETEYLRDGGTIPALSE